MQPEGVWGNSGSHLLSLAQRFPGDNAHFIPEKRPESGHRWQLPPSAIHLRTTNIYNFPLGKEIRHDSKNRNLINICLSIVGIFCIVYFENWVIKLFKIWELGQIKINYSCHRYLCIIDFENTNNPLGFFFFKTFIRDTWSDVMCLL